MMEQYLSPQGCLLFYSTVIAIGFILLIWILDKIILPNDKSIFDYFKGQDGKYSTSKFQFFVFTFAFVFSFVLLHTYFWFLTKGFRLIDTIPQNVLIAMGFSCFTFVGAKAITVTQISSGRISKPAATTGNKLSDLVSDDSGNLDFSKLQMLIWTLIAIIIFFIDTYRIIAFVNQHGGAKYIDDYAKQKDPIGLLPDISPALMVLMGLGQGAYLGGKLVLAPTPRLTALIRNPPVAPATTPTVTLKGGDFGSQQGSNQILIDGVPLPGTAKVTAWANNSIDFDPGPTHPNGKSYTTGQVLQIGVMINGFVSANTLPFTF